MENSIKNRKPNSVNVDLDAETQKLIEESSRRLAEQRELEKANRSQINNNQEGGGEAVDENEGDGDKNNEDVTGNEGGEGGDGDDGAGQT